MHQEIEKKEKDRDSLTWIKGIADKMTDKAIRKGEWEDKKKWRSNPRL